MASASEVITIDSGEEDSTPAPSQEPPPQPPPPPLAPPPVLLPPPPTASPAQAGPSFTSASPMVPQAPRMPPSRNRTRSLPKRPGQFPPFALFSQEQRPKLQEGNPDMSFAELGRQLGEMWHGLTEETKNDYRKRAREIQEKKLKEWQRLHQQQAARVKQTVRIQQMQRGVPTSPRLQYGGNVGRNPVIIRPQTGTPQGPRLVANNYALAQSVQHKRRRTHGYAVFSAERKKVYTMQGLDLNETMQRVAREWRMASAKVKQGYETKARRINILEDEKQRHHPQQQQQQQQQQQLHHMQPISPPGFKKLPNLPPSTTLRISKVASLSTTAKSSAVPPNIDLPSSISISRVEPEVSIVAEQPGAQLPMTRLARQVRQVPTSTSIRPANVGNGGRLISSLEAVNSVHPRPAMNRMGAPSQRIPGGLKRPLMQQRQVPTTKRIRLPQAVPEVDLGCPVNPMMLSQNNKLCRLCSVAYPKNGPLYSLGDRPELIKKIAHILEVKLDLEADKTQGYPGVVCKKCFINVSLFYDFKILVYEGFAKLGRILEVCENSKEAEATGAPKEAAGVLGSSSAGLDTSTEQSILPDLELEVEVAEEKVQLPPLPAPFEVPNETDTDISVTPVINEEFQLEANSGEKSMEEKKEEEESKEAKSPATVETQAISNDSAENASVEEVDPLVEDLLAEDIPEQSNSSSTFDPLSFVQVGSCRSIRDSDLFEGDTSKVVQDSEKEQEFNGLQLAPVNDEEATKEVQ